MHDLMNDCILYSYMLGFVRFRASLQSGGLSGVASLLAVSGVGLGVGIGVGCLGAFCDLRALILCCCYSCIFVISEVFKCIILHITTINPTQSYTIL